MTSLPKAMRRAVLTAKTLATAIAPEFKRTPLATGGRGKRAKTIIRVPLDHIEHGESALPGGKLTEPGAGDRIKKYAEMKTPFPPIEVVSNDPDSERPWMVYDGSHRLEAARLRGEKDISATVSHHDDVGVDLAKKYPKARASGGAVDGDDAADDDSPYYSPLAQGLKAAKLDSGPPAYWKNTISKLPGAAEAKDTGLHDFIDSHRGDVPKQALLDHLAMNSPQLQEHWFQQVPGRSLNEDRPRFTDHTLDGGETHKELSINLPLRSGQEPFKSPPAHQYKRDMRIGPDGRHTTGKDFPIGPIHGDPADYNRLVHVRMNDRRGPKGEKLLHIDELQSDWHQKGREHGYDVDKPYYYVQNKKSGNRSPDFDTPEMAAFYTSRLPEGIRGDVETKRGTHSNPKGAPNGPLKDTKQWTELALRRALKHAADHGYHGITWTTGDQQADRYDLSKHIDEIRSDPWTTKPGWRTVHIGLPQDGHGVEFHTDEHGKIGGVEGYGEGDEMSRGWRGKHISDVLGKDIGKQILESEGKLRLSSKDLRVGGEGMRKFYDEIVPSVANKIGKEHGVQAGMTHIGKLKTYSIVPDARNVHHLFPDEDPEAGPIYSSVHRDAVEKHRDMLRDADSKVHYLPVTPSMAGKKVRKYKRGGTVGPELGAAMMVAANVLNRKKRGQ